MRLLTYSGVLCGVLANWQSVLADEGLEVPKPYQPTSADQRERSWQWHVQLREQSPHKDLRWRSVGPRCQGGRIEAIACPPDSPSTLYVGVGSGGIWKTTNNGVTWKAIFQDQATCAIGDIAVSQVHPETVWVGTGEVLMARSALAGMGVFKSTDGGTTWRNMGLRDTHHIGRVLIDPHQDEVVYVAAIGHRSSANEQRGLFKTTDGGESWVKVLYVDDQTSVIDIAFDPNDSKTLYATTWQRDPDGGNNHGPNSGIHKTTDAGETWQRLAGGLPAGDAIGRIGIDVARSNSQVVYALVDQGEQDGLYRSEDGGQTWRQVNREPVQARWDWCEIRVSPDNEDELYNIGQRSFVSRDGGETFQRIGGVILHLLPHPSRILHLDTHAMWINPKNTNQIVFGNDGGLFVSYDRAANWLHLNNLPIAEVYSVTCDLDQPYNIYIGTQDNAALFGPSTHVPEAGAPEAWKHVYIDRWGGGDSYFTYRDPTDRDTIYYEHQYGELRRKSMSTGEVKDIKPRLPESEGPLRFDWMTPYFPSVHDPNTLYYGANRVFRSGNRGDQWQVISPDLTAGPRPRNTRYVAISALAESPSEKGWLYAGTDTGNLFLTTNDGQNWDAIHQGLPRYAVTRVTPSPHDSQKVYVTLSGMGDDDFAPYVFKSLDSGKTWNSISRGLPLETVHVIREDPRVAGRLYLGTDLGVYTSPDDGLTWHSLHANLPTAAVYDLCVHPREPELIAGTHGLSVFVLDISSLTPEP